MADELHLLPGDNPQAYIPGDRRRALARGQELPRLTHGPNRRSREGLGARTATDLV